MYSNGVRRTEEARFNAVGYTSASPWNNGAMGQGELMFRGQCLNCHTLDGYRSIRRLMKGRDRQSITNFLALLHDMQATSSYRNFMPPMVGTQEERGALASYLDRQVNGGGTSLAKR